MSESSAGEKGDGGGMLLLMSSKGELAIDGLACRLASRLELDELIVEWSHFIPILQDFFYPFVSFVVLQH